jgi:hypothetical protein
LADTVHQIVGQIRATRLSFLHGYLRLLTEEIALGQRVQASPRGREDDQTRERARAPPLLPSRGVSHVRHAFCKFDHALRKPLNIHCRFRPSFVRCKPDFPHGLDRNRRRPGAASPRRRSPGPASSHLRLASRADRRKITDRERCVSRSGSGWVGRSLRLARLTRSADPRRYRLRITIPDGWD